MAMLIAGWFSLGARERGAFGFSNEKSLMYCPSTLSDGACCCGGGVGPPLVLVMLRYPPCPAGIPHRAAWLTQGAGPDKDHERVFLRLRCRGGSRSRSCASIVSEIWCHSSGARSITSGWLAARFFLAARPIAAPIQRRAVGNSSSAPATSVIKPGNTR